MSNRSSSSSIADNPRVRGFFEKQGLNNSLVRKYIAGITLRDVLIVAKELHDAKYQCAFKFLPETVIEAADAERNVNGYLELIRQMSIFSVDSFLSLRLSAIGLSLSEQLATDNFHRLVEEARTRGEIYIRVEPEKSELVAVSLQILLREHRNYEHIGAVIQAHLRRTDQDISTLVKERISARLVEGSFSEPAIAAFQSQTDIEAAFRKHMYFLLEHGNRTAIGAQSADLITIARKYIKQHNIPKNQYEFEFMYGVRRELQQDLLKEGHSVRIYIPFGLNWYPYFSRRISEAGFSLTSLFGK